jgi:hypothetical protein
MEERRQDGEVILEFHHPAIAAPRDEAARIEHRDTLQTAIVKILTHIAVVQDPESYVKQVAGEERGIGRALMFSDIEIAAENIFGADYDFQLTSLLKESGWKRYPLRRDREWNAGSPSGSSVSPPKAPQPGVGESATDFMAIIPHRERRISSLIDIPLWDRAKWCATAYVRDPSQDPIMLLGLGFSDIESAKEIFAVWRKRLGKQDVDDALRVSIVTGVTKSNPAAYNVIIGTNLKFDSWNKSVIVVSRINHMTPRDTTNLDMFLESV